MNNDAAIAALKQKDYQVVATGPRAKDLQSLASLQSNRIMTLEQIGKDLATFGQELEVQFEPLFRKVSIQHVQLNEQNTIKLTDEGERKLAQLWNVVEQAENLVLSGFSEYEERR